MPTNPCALSQIANGEKERLSLLTLSSILLTPKSSNQTGAIQSPLTTGMLKHHCASNIRLRDLANQLNASGLLDNHLSQITTSALLKMSLKLPLPSRLAQ
jgi:hypothetical protein